ncbi:SWIM zinc finger family protein [Streptosporangium sp. DT93]|uniref:SWIM zinc finger family protein n=1 Tax=Streptosporangium sp. DT93 TaxID=3393428 RepID=UPI003CEE96E3
MQRIADLIGAEAERAGRAALARGGELAGAGAVQLVRFNPTLVTAEVDDDAACVEFRIVDETLRRYCSCPEGRDGVFCAHCVATAQSVRMRTDRKDSPGASSATASESTVRTAS